jgi:hypothetical protein
MSSAVRFLRVKLPTSSDAVESGDGRLLRAFWSVDILPSRRPAGTL